MFALCTNALAFSMMVTAAFGLSRRLVKRPQTIDVLFDNEGVLVSLDTSKWKNAMDKSRQRPWFMVLANETDCLNFLHIPKSGGSTIEDKNATGLKDGPEWGSKDETLQCTGMQPCPDDFPWLGHRRCCPMEDGNVCSVWHVPPHMDKELEEHYAQCETFCVVRNPAERFRSQHVWNPACMQQPAALHACSTESLSDAVDRKFQELENQPYADDCHLIPQVEYWRNGHSCQHILKLESLDADFSRLVERFGMKAEIHYPDNRGVPCDAPFDERSLEKLQKHYAADYEAFGYARS